MDGGQRLCVAVWASGMLALVILVGMSEWIRAGTAAEAIKAGLSQDAKGHWVKTERKAEDGE